MKIGLISAEFPPERGGVQTYAWEYAHELARRGHEITVFTQAHPGGEARSEAIRIEPILHQRRRLDRPMFSRFPMDIWHALNAAYAWIALEVAPAFVTVHGNDFVSPYQSVARLDLRSRLRLPFGSNLDYQLGRWLTRRLIARALPRVAHIFTNSRYTEGRFLAQHPSCTGRTSAAMVGVKEQFFTQQRSSRNPGPPRLVTICRLEEEHKNVHLVLGALAELKSSWDFQYTIIGDGPLRPRLEALTRELGLQDRVTFTGAIATSALHEHLLQSDLFILTTGTCVEGFEGFGLVYLEANACGCPTLAARLAGAVEAVQEGVSGMFVDELTVSTIASAVRRFLSGEVQFSSAACMEFARSFRWSRVADFCLAKYQQNLAA